MRTSAHLAMLVAATILVSSVVVGGADALNGWRPSATVPLSGGSEAWHAGSNFTTPQVNVTYDQTWFNMGPASGGGGDLQNMGETMMLTYNDSSGSFFDLNIDYNFNPGGIDVANHTVLDWSKMYWMAVSIQSGSWQNQTWAGTSYSLLGFFIVNGTASNFSLFPNHNEGGGGSNWEPANAIADLTYASRNATIGALTLSTEPYAYKNATLEESVAIFNVSLSSQIAGNNAPPGSKNITGTNVTVPTTLTFKVTHTLTTTSYKYGAAVDMSGAKAFPTNTHEKTGQNYSFVAMDRAQYAHANEQTWLENFTTNGANSTAYYNWSGKPQAEEYFTQNYTIDGNSTVRNTTRVYIENQSVSNGVDNSAVFIVFDGFRYNVSTGFTFDPQVTVQSSGGAPPGSFGTGPTLGSIPSDEWALIGVVILGIGGAIGAVLLVRYERGRRHPRARAT